MNSHVRMQKAQTNYDLSERLIRAISHWSLHDDEDVETLIDQGADVNRPSGTVLPLQCACNCGDVEMTKLLLARGALVSALDGYGRAVLHYAAEQEDPSCVKLLLDAGADVNQRCMLGNIPAHWAAARLTCHQTLSVLLQNGAQVNAVNNHRQTPLTWAAHNGHVQAVLVLLDYNADPHIVDQWANIAHVMCAVQANRRKKTGQESRDGVDHYEVLRLLLLASGASVRRYFITTDHQDRKDINLHPCIRNEEEILKHKLEEHMRQLLVALVLHVRPLSHLCRCEIRRQIGQGYLPDRVQTLHLPEKIRNFLLIRT